MTRPEIHPLTTSVGAEALRAAASQPDPDSLAAATALRSRFAPEVAAAALTQIGFRRSARSKLGERADGMLFTRAGLEQASRAAVAAHHAARFAAAGAHRVVDLGCGIGADALALLDAGLEVVAVEADPETASIAQANLGDRAEVLIGDAVELAPSVLGPGVAAFADPARRTGRGRSWRIEDLSPPWSFVETLLAGDRVAGVKLGPGLPHRVIPDGVEAEWVSEHGDTVEVGLWAGAGSRTDGRVALLLPTDRMIVDPTAPVLTAGPVGQVLYEPAGAVIRAGGVAQLGADLNARLLHPDIAYLTADVARSTPYATAFEVLDVRPYTEQGLRHWARDQGIGTLEIKKRGLDLDPAVLRRRLRLRGSAAATVILARTPAGAAMLVVRRLAPPTR
ncbi:MAG TPA: class I SAM-dependent methyltransferase [Microlunatus sp.]